MKRQFTTHEIATIRSLIREKSHASRDRQKAIRAQMRALGFEISSFAMTYEAFTIADLDRLIGEHTIQVVD